MHARRPRSLLVLALSATMLIATACGGDGGGAAVTTAPVQERVTVTPETVTTPFALAAGTYRLTWATTDCASVAVRVVGDTGFDKEKTSTLPNFSWILTSVPDGTYTATQTDPACTTWQITIEKM